MPPTTLAHVTPDVLRWARNSAGFDLKSAAAKIGVKEEKLDAAEEGTALLTLRQAERAASLYQRPLAALFMPAPLAEEPPEAQFRRVPGAPEPPWPSEMLLLVRRVRERQEAAAELYGLLEEEPAWTRTRESFARGELPRPDLARQALAIDIEEQTAWRDSSGYTPLRQWTDAVERLGVLVMQDGTMPVETMRGFAGLHPLVPAIVVNTRDDPRARAFTLIHELGHLYLSALGEPEGPDTERWCDEFAGQVLMPLGWIERMFASLHTRPSIAAVDEIALTFGVTPRAAAVRLARTEIWSQEAVSSVLEQIAEREPRERGSGGNYYLTQIGRLGPTYIQLVFAALDGQVLTYPLASSLLGGVKVSNFTKLRGQLDERMERG